MAAVGMQLCIRRRGTLPAGLHSLSGKTVRKELQSPEAGNLQADQC